MSALSRINRQVRDGRKDEGFTLIELLIVIVVLGVLAAVVVFALASVTGNAHQSACRADAKTIETAVGAYNAQNSASITVEASSNDFVTTDAHPPLTPGWSIVDLSRGAPASVVIANVDATHMTVPSGDSSFWVSGDLLSFNSGAVFAHYVSSVPGGSGITPGSPSTYAGGSQASLLVSSNLLKSWPIATNGYSMSLSQTVAGNVTIYVPATNPSGVDFETEASNTGCNDPSL